MLCPRSTYFGKDLILQLGANGSVPLEVLGQVAKAVIKTRPPGDKGARGALQALLQVGAHAITFPREGGGGARLARRPGKLARAAKGDFRNRCVCAR